MFRERKRGLRLLIWALVVPGLFLLVGQVWTGPAILAGTCPPVQNTPRFTIAYGAVMLDGVVASAGTVVEAVSPRDDVVGCFVVESEGNYGSMYVYGEDTSVDPPVPGMQDGETVAFRVDGAAATASPELTWSNDRDLHQVDLSATTVVCYDLDGSGTVDVGDFSEMGNAWRATDAASLDRYDFNETGIVDVGDFITLGLHLGESSCSP